MKEYPSTISDPDSTMPFQRRARFLGEANPKLENKSIISKVVRAAGTFGKKVLRAIRVPIIK